MIITELMNYTYPDKLTTNDNLVGHYWYNIS